MIILAMDTSSVNATVAVCDENKILGEYTISSERAHSQMIIPMLDNLHSSLSLTLNDVDVFSVCLGPGSFTGVRIGAATVKGIAYGKNKPCVSVSTLEALAYNLKDRDGLICPVMNARRQQVYNALFESKDGELTRLCPDRAISITELDEELADKTLPVYLSGDGYEITEKGFNKTDVKPVGIRQRYQCGYSVAQIALKKYEKNDTVSDSELAPIYLRPSQAERERQARLEAESEVK